MHVINKPALVLVLQSTERVHYAEAAVIALSLYEQEIDKLGTIRDTTSEPWKAETQERINYLVKYKAYLHDLLLALSDG